MAFVNETISETDIEKYGIRDINKRFRCSNLDWTIDRDRDVYLRQVGQGREEFSHQSIWTFFWRGELLTVDLDTEEAGGTRGGACWSHKRVRRIQVPRHLADKRSQILDDLKEALMAYKNGGVYATASTYTLTLDV